MPGAGTRAPGAPLHCPLLPYSGIPKPMPPSTGRREVRVLSQASTGGQVRDFKSLSLTRAVSAATPEGSALVRARPRYCGPRMTPPAPTGVQRSKSAPGFLSRPYARPLARGGGGSRLVRRFRFYSGPSLRVSGSLRAPERTQFLGWLCHLPACGKTGGGPRCWLCLETRERETLMKTLKDFIGSRSPADRREQPSFTYSRWTARGTLVKGRGKGNAVVRMEGRRGRQ